MTYVIFGFGTLGFIQLLAIHHTPLEVDFLHNSISGMLRRIVPPSVVVRLRVYVLVSRGDVERRFWKCALHFQGASRTAACFSAVCSHHFQAARHLLPYLELSEFLLTLFLVHDDPVVWFDVRCAISCLKWIFDFESIDYLWLALLSRQIVWKSLVAGCGPLFDWLPGVLIFKLHN